MYFTGLILLTSMERGIVVWCLCALRAQRGVSISLYWTFSAKHLGIDMVVSCVAIKPELSGFIATGYIAIYTWLFSQIYLAI